MRGLTLEERDILSTWYKGRTFTMEQTERQRSARLEMARLGRILPVGTAPGGGVLWRRTDFADLALRVCPVDES